MKKYLLVIFIILPFCSNAQSKAEKAIQKVLAAQTAAWNNGDIDTFMQGYWKNDSLMFIGKSGITYGWQKTLDNYKKSYPDAQAMGKLEFTILQIKSLSKQYYSVAGKWHLERQIGNLQGYFTLIFKKIKGKWLIISDHSS